MPSSSSSTIPRWKAVLLEKRKSAQRLRGDSIPVWKRELLKKLHSNNKLEVDSNTITDDKLVISEPIVKVSQNIFVVRETKAGNSIKRGHVTSKFQQQPSFNVIKTEDVIIIENTQQPIPPTTTTRTEISSKMADIEPVADDKPTQGIVSRLKNRFMNDRTTPPPQFNNKYKKVSVSFPPKKSTPEVEHVETTTSTIEKKLPVSSIDDNPLNTSLSRRTNSEIELFSTTNEPQTNGDVTKSSFTATNPRLKFDHRSRAASIDLLAPKGYKPATSTTPATNSIHQVKSLSLSPTKRDSPKEKIPTETTTKVEHRSAGGSSRVELKGKVKVDSTHISGARANAYNELMQESRTFQIIPRSAKANNIPPAATAPVRTPSPAPATVDDLPCTDIDDLVDLPLVTPPEEEPRSVTPEPPIVIKPPVLMDVKIIPKQQPEVSRTKAPSPPPPISEYKEKKVAPSVPAPQPVAADPPAPAARFRPQIQSAKSMYGTRPVGGSGRSFTIDPSKYKRSAAPPVQSNAAKSREASDNTVTIVPKISAPRQPVATIPEVDIVKKSGKRKPAVDQIEVVGGYVKLSRSLLKHSGGKKKSVRILIDNKEFTPGQGADVNANSNNNSNNNNNNNSKFFNRSRMYIPNSERNLDEKADRFTEIRLDSPPSRNPVDIAPPPPLPAKKKMEEKFVSYIDDHDLDADSSSTTSSSSEDIQALPTTADSAAFFSDVTTNDLLF